MNIIDKLIYFYSTDKIQEFNQTLNKENNKEIIIQLIKQFINDKIHLLLVKELFYMNVIINHYYLN